MKNKHKINVLHVIETLDIGGAECVVADLVNNLPENISPFICCIKHKGDVAKRIKPNIEIFSLGKTEGNSLSLPFRLAKIMREKKIAAIHTHNWGVFCESVVAAILARVPVRIHMAHGGLLAHPNNIWGIIKRRIRRLTEFTAALFCDKVITVSDDLKKILIKEIGIAEQKIVVIRNGIKIIPVNHAARESIYSQLGRNKDEFIICFIGRLAPIKNIPFLLSALEEICALYPLVRLLLVGDGPEKNALKEFVATKNLTENVFFLGTRNDVRDILSICQLFVLPSLSEGVSISLLEAMSMKVPVVATNVGGNAEVIEDGKTGILVESNNVCELKSAIRRIIDSPEERKCLAEKAHLRITSHFNIDKNIATIASMYTGKD